MSTKPITVLDNGFGSVNRTEAPRLLKARTALPALVLAVPIVSMHRFSPRVLPACEDKTFQDESCWSR